MHLAPPRLATDSLNRYYKAIGTHVDDDVHMIELTSLLQSSAVFQKDLCDKDKIIIWYDRNHPNENSYAPI